MTRIGRSAVVASVAALLCGSAAPALGAPIAAPWLSPAIVARQAAAKGDDAKLAVARDRARRLVAAMTLDQKLQQMTGSAPSLLPELPGCYGARHVAGIAALGVPTFRISNGPVGVGQNDCVARSLYDAVVAGKGSSYAAYTHPSSAQATALPSAMGVAASFDPAVAARFGGVIATEMNDLGLHVFEAPSLNLARLPILGRNFEYFGEDPFLTGTMAVAETRAVQSKGLIAMAKHFIANEQETNRQTIQETIDEQTLHELYLLPFEMAVRDARIGGIMCAYNYVNAVHSCENEPLLTGVLRRDWGFVGYVQTDFFAMKSTAPTLKAGLNHEMPTPQYWAPAKLKAALAAGEIDIARIDQALERRFTQMFRVGIFDRPLVQRPIDFAADAKEARAIGVRTAVLLQNNGALPLAATVRSVVLVGKASQVYAQQAVAGGALLGQPMGGGGGSSDVVPHATVTPADGLRAALRSLSGGKATLATILVDDANSSATIDGRTVPFADALAAIAAADAVVAMAGTNAEEGADRAAFAGFDGHRLAAGAAAGSSLDWYVAKPNVIALGEGTGNVARSSGTVAMLKAIMAAPSTSGRPMATKTVLVLKDNAGPEFDPALLGPNGPAILEAWFPGQEDGDIVGDLLVGKANPSGRLPVTMPVAGRGFLDAITPEQFPGVPGADGRTQTVTYREKLAIGYRWYDGDPGGRCTPVAGRNPCVAFPFGHGLSYTSFRTAAPTLSVDRATGGFRAGLTVTNTGRLRGAEVVQVYLSLPAGATAIGAAQPAKRLVGFARVDLAPGATQRVSVAVDAAGSHHPLQVWDVRAKAWTIPKGRYVVRIGTSSSPADLVEAGSFDR